MVQIVLASCHDPPVEPDDDPRLAAELEKAGCEVAIRPWTEIEPARMPPGSAVVLRSTWDYHRQAGAFLDWIDRLEARGTRVLNASGLVRLTVDKSWLTAERPFGCTVPETVLVPALSSEILPELDRRGWRRYVLKPPVSASAQGTFLLETDDWRGLETALAGQPQQILVQEFLPEIREGELSLVFFDGWYSHAVCKRPAPGEFRVQSEFGSRTERFRPAAPVISAARRAVQALPEIPCYARVDGILRNGSFVLMELELIEPELFLRLMPGSVEAFAQTILRRLPMAPAVARTP